MTVPNPIGPVHFDAPRAVRVREPEDLKNVHSAVYSGVSIYTDTQTQADALIASWPVIMQAVADKAQEIVGALVKVGDG